MLPAPAVTLEGAIVALGAICWCWAVPDARRLRGLVGDVGDVVDADEVPPTGGATAYGVPLKGSAVVADDGLKWPAAGPPDTVSCEGDADMGLGFRLRLVWCGEVLCRARRCRVSVLEVG